MPQGPTKYFVKHTPTIAPPPNAKKRRDKGIPATRRRLALLLADTDGAATATGGLGVLTTHTETPVVTETTVGADLLQTLEVLTGLLVDTVGKHVGVLAVGDVALSVEEPGGDLVLGGVLEDGDHTLELFGGELTGTAF